MVPMDTRTLGITAWSKSRINHFYLDWAILGYLFFGEFFLGGIWDLREKREGGQWMKIPSGWDSGVGILGSWVPGLVLSIFYKNRESWNKLDRRDPESLNPIPWDNPRLLQAQPGLGHFRGWSRLDFSEPNHPIKFHLSVIPARFARGTLLEAAAPGCDFLTSS